MDDFENYADAEGTRIYETWIDGATNSTGSQVGYRQSPFAEQTVVHGGGQSMPLAYNNAAARSIARPNGPSRRPKTGRANGADTLTLWFRGNPLALSCSVPMAACR